MAKKKKSIELSNEKIEFTLQEIIYKVIRYYPDKMTLDVMKLDKDNTKLGMQNIPFAHLPREIKKRIKPN
jgi:hypothetical protein